MLSLPFHWEQLRMRGDNSGSRVLRIYGSSLPAEVAFAETSFVDSGVFGVDYILGTLLDISPITHGNDYSSCEYQPAHIEAVVSNLFVGRDGASSKWRRVTDLIGGDAWDASVLVYWHPGGYGTPLTSNQSLILFVGSLTSMQCDGDSRVRIMADEISNIDHRDLPQRKATRGVFPKINAELVDTSLPLVYGLCMEGSDLRQYGFALGIPIEQWKWVFSDHPSYNFFDIRISGSVQQRIWIWIDALQAWAGSYLGVTFDTDDSGRATATVDPLGSGFDVYLNPTAGYPTSTGTDGSNTAPPSDAFDYDADTKVSVLANSSTQAEIIFEWRQNGSDTNHATENGVADMNGPSGADGPLSGIQINCSSAAATIASSSMDYWDGGAWVSITTSITRDIGIHVHYEKNFFTGAKGTYWHFATGGQGGDGTPFKIRIRFVGSGWTTDTTVVAYINEIRLCRSCKFPRQVYYQSAKASRRGLSPDNSFGIDRDKVPLNPGTTAYMRRSDVVAPSAVGASLWGRMYGTWIDLGGRTNPYSTGDIISSAVGMIESILRDELGYSQIDDASFDALYSGGSYKTQARINLIPASSINSKALIDRICFEHRLVLMRRRDSGSLRIFSDLGTGELAGTLTPADLVDGIPQLSLTDSGSRVGEIIVRYRKLPHDNKYFKTLTATDSNYWYTTVHKNTQEISCDTIAFHDATFPNLGPLTDRLINVQALWSRAHYLVDFTTIGPRFAHVELGDEFEFSATHFDEILPLFGASWSGKRFVIYEQSILKNAVNFKAICWTPVA